MADNAVIGALRVVLGADSAAFEKGLKNASEALGTFAGVAAKLAPTLAAAFSFDKAIDSIKSTIDQFDNLSKTAQKIGVPVEQLSALRHAAELSDVSMESLQKGVARLARNLVDGAQGLQTPVKAFDALGISIHNTDGSIKTISQALPEIADKFARMKDGPEKTALSMQLLGRAGADLIPMLNGGSAGLKELTDEAAQFGLVISTNTAQTAEAFNDNLTRLHAILNGVATQFTANIIPALASFSQFLIDGAKNSGFLETAVSVLTTGFNALARTAIVIYDNMDLVLKIGAVFVGSQMGTAAISFGLAFVKMAAAIRATGIVMGAFELIRGISMRGLLLMAGIVALAAGAFDGFGEKIGKIGNLISNLLPEGSGEKVQGILGALGLNLQGLTADLNKWQNTAGKDGGGIFNPKIVNQTKNALDQYLSSQQKHIASQTAETQTVGKSVGEQAKLRIELEAQALAKEKNIPLTDALNARIAATGDAAALAAMKLQGAQLTQQVMDPAEVFAQKMEQQKQLYEAGAISLDTYGKAQQQVAEQAGATWDIAGASIAGSFSQISAAFGKESSSMATAAKVFGVIQGTISMFTGAAKALELPFPANIAAVAAVLAKGASLVASIKSQTVPSGYMTGGSFTVGGSGGPDSTPVSFMASPGEQVDVWRPDQGGGADPRRGGGGTPTVNLSLPIATTRDALRELIDGLNDMFTDGYRLKTQAA